MDLVMGESVPVPKPFPTLLTMVKLNFLVFGFTCSHMALEHIFSASHILFAVRTGKLGLSTVILGLCLATASGLSDIKRPPSLPPVHFSALHL